MRGVLLPLSLFLAAAATVGIALVVTREAGEDSPQATEPVAAPEPDEQALAQPRAAALRPYETTVTLVEDLRDALAGPPKTLERECWRVSRALKRRARWTLEHLARHEASPRVRALLVLAAGLHSPDEESALRYLSDREPVVRRAAALACGYLARGEGSEEFLGFPVPLGRNPADTARATLRLRQGLEQSREVKETIDAVLKAAEVSSGR